MAGEIQLSSPKCQENAIKQVSEEVESSDKATRLPLWVAEAIRLMQSTETELCSIKSPGNEIEQVISSKSQENEIKHVSSSKSEAETKQIDIKIDFSHRKSGRAKLIEDRSALRKIKSAIRDVFKHRGIWKYHMKLPKRNPEVTWSVKTVAMLIAVMWMFAGAAYLALFAFHDAFPISAPFTSVNLSTWELFTFPSAAIEDFLVIITVTIPFIICIGVITYGVCFIFMKFAWGTFLTILSVFAIIVFLLSFLAMLSKFVPHYITIDGGNIKVPAIYIVIFYDIYVIAIVCALACAAQCLRSCWRKQDADLKRPIVV